MLFESLREVLLTFDAGGEVARGGTERDRLKRVEEDARPVPFHIRLRDGAVGASLVTEPGMDR